MNFQYLYIGMSGNKMVDSLNGNFKEVLSTFLKVSNELDIRIVSSDVKEIKVVDDVIYYTTDVLDPESETDTRVWNSLQATWGKVVGNIEDQKDLKEALDNKVGNTAFETLSENFTNLLGDFVVLSGNFADLTNRVVDIQNLINNTDNGILIRLDDIENTLTSKITSNDVLEIRKAEDGNLEYTTDGFSWNPVADTGFVEWGNIIGDINNQPDLRVYLDDINDMIGEIKSMLPPFETHINNVQNPHSVTAEQIGLGNVDNTSDVNKPVSIAQQTAINNAMDSAKEGAIREIEKDISFISITKEDYEDLEDKKDGVIYFINDL